jgi:predicted alpha/beta hydrolase family esterase
MVTRNAVLLHGLIYRDEYYDEGVPTGSQSNWLPWLKKQLMMHDIKADTPEIPRPFDFDYATWVAEVERFELTSATTLVGQSMGSGFWVRYLSEHPGVRVHKVFLVAPWLNVDREEPTDFFDFEIDPGITRRAGEFTVFTSDNDRREAMRTVELLRNRLPDARIRVFPGHGHFTPQDLGTTAVPELRDAILS